MKMMTTIKTRVRLCSVGEICKNFSREVTMKKALQAHSYSGGWAEINLVI